MVTSSSRKGTSRKKPAKSVKNQSADEGVVDEVSPEGVSAEESQEEPTPPKRRGRPRKKAVEETTVAPVKGTAAPRKRRATPVKKSKTARKMGLVDPIGESAVPAETESMKQPLLKKNRLPKK